MPSIYQEKNNKWTCAYHTPVAGKTDTNGRPLKKRVVERGFARKKDAEAWYAQHVESIAAGTILDVKRLTVAVWMRRWLSVYCAQLAPNTRIGYKNSIEKHIIPAIGAHKIIDLRPDLVQEFVNQLAALRRKLKSGEERPYSSGHIRQVYVCLDAAMTRAVDDELLQRSPCRRITLPEVARPRREYCNMEQLQAILADLRETRYYIAAQLYAVFGLRRGEGLGLKWDHVDLDAGTMQIAEQVRRGDAGMEQSERLKSGSSYRKHNLPPAVVEALKTQRRRQLEDKLAAGGLYIDEGYVSATALGLPMHPDSVTRAINKAIEKVAPGLSVKDLRHSCATLMRQDNALIEVVAAVLGHSDTRTTQRYYIGDDAQAQQKAVSGIASKLLK